MIYIYMGVSKNRGTPKSSILIGFSIIFTIHFGVPLFLETPIYTYICYSVGWQIPAFYGIIPPSCGVGGGGSSGSSNSGRSRSSSNSTSTI